MQTFSGTVYHFLNNTLQDTALYRLGEKVTVSMYPDKQCREWFSTQMDRLLAEDHRTTRMVL